MKDNSNILEEARQQILDFYSPCKDPVAKIRLNTAMTMINIMIAIQKSFEKYVTKMANHAQKNSHTKGR